MDEWLKILIMLPMLFLLPGKIYGQSARGADIGWLSEMEDAGRIWRDSTGRQKDLLDILDDYCINSIRLRVWVNPAGGWSGKEDVVHLARRAFAKGYRIMIDFHYSDSWADPGKQNKPLTWQSYNVASLEQAIYDHTIDVLQGLKAENIVPEWVQVGNETNNGLLWPEGQASSQMGNYAKFVSSGYKAVKSLFPQTKVIVHVSNGYDNALFRWNIGGLLQQGAQFDVIGMSMYPENTEAWKAYADQTLNNMKDMIHRYGKEIMISEVGLPVSAPSEARQLVERIISDLQSLPAQKGLGVFWWEPEAYDWKGYDKVAWNGGSGSNAFQATEAMKGFMKGCQNITATTEKREDEKIYTVHDSGDNDFILVATEAMELVVYNALGVLMEKLDAAENRKFGAAYRPGIYFVRGEGSGTIVRKLIKK